VRKPEDPEGSSPRGQLLNPVRADCRSCSIPPTLLTRTKVRALQLTHRANPTFPVRIARGLPLTLTTVDVPHRRRPR